MKTLRNHLILFDAECPMCRAYTKVFVESGLLEKEGRTSYQDFPPDSCPVLDRQRAANEIALVNQETGEVSYGIESLFKVFAAAVPLLKPLFLFRPFVRLSSKLYAFISYNRRVIIPAASSDGSEVQPAFKLQYRLAYLFVTWAITSLVLSNYTALLEGLLPDENGQREYFICGGQILFQSVIISIVNKAKRWDYLGNMMTISLTGALLLLPLLVVAQWFPVSATIAAAWFLIVAGLMFLEHIRRSTLLKIGLSLTLSWVAYRLVLLLFIL